MGADVQQVRTASINPLQHVNPGPMSVMVAQKPDRTIQLHIYHATGATVVELSPEHAKPIAEQILAKCDTEAPASRLVVPGVRTPPDLRGKP